MESRVICPICQVSGLMQANGAGVVKKALVVCSNEHYIHWRISGHHFLTRTNLNLVEEESREVVMSLN